MMLTKANRDKPFIRRMVLKFGKDKLYYFSTSEAPKTGFYRFKEGTFIGYLITMKYSAIMVF